MINGYELERWSGNRVSAAGEHGWELLLSHDDITIPGRVKTFGVVTNGSPVRVELSVDDRFNFARRTRLLEQASGEIEFIGTRTVFGKHLPNGLGYFYVVYPNGDVRVTPDFYKG